MSNTNNLRFPANSLAIALCFLCVVTVRGFSPVDYFVSPQGSDSASGTREAPFQSIHHARKIAIQIIPETNPRAVNIWLLDGRHTLDQPLEFYPEDNQYG